MARRIRGVTIPRWVAPDDGPSVGILNPNRIPVPVVPVRCSDRLNLDDGDPEDGLHLDVASDTSVPLGDGRTKRVPDCTIVARDGWDGAVPERYYCEVKTGDAPLERSQVAAMERLARDERVVKIRMDVDEMPEQYALQIHDVEPPD